MQKKKNNLTKLTVDTQTYPLDAIYGASYVFIDRAYLFLKSQSNKKIEVLLKGKKQLNNKQLEALKGEFLNELLNYTVRIKLAKYNRRLREQIVSQALFSAVGEEEIPKDSSSEKFEFEEDPEGIAVPWEEKYNKKAQSSAVKSKIKK